MIYGIKVLCAVWFLVNLLAYNYRHIIAGRVHYSYDLNYSVLKSVENKILFEVFNRPNAEITQVGKYMLDTFSGEGIPF